MNSRKEERVGPMSIAWSDSDSERESGVLLRRTESRACVPQAFWMVWAAKKRESAAAWSKVPSRGAEVLV